MSTPVHITPVINTDSDGWLSSKIWGIIGLAAVMVAAIAITIATFGIGSVAATIAITSTISIVSQSLVVGKAQTYYSKSEGDTESEVNDDTIDAISNFLFSPQTTTAYYIPFIKLVPPLLKGIGSKGVSIGQGISNAFTKTATIGSYVMAYGICAVQVGITIAVWNDEQKCLWVADKYGWNPL